MVWRTCCAASPERVLESSFDVARTGPAYLNDCANRTPPDRAAIRRSEDELSCAAHAALDHKEIVSSLTSPVSLCGVTRTQRHRSLACRCLNAQGVRSMDRGVLLASGGTQPDAGMDSAAIVRLVRPALLVNRRHMQSRASVRSLRLHPTARARRTLLTRKSPFAAPRRTYRLLGGGNSSFQIRRVESRPRGGLGRFPGGNDDVAQQVPSPTREGAVSS